MTPSIGGGNTARLRDEVVEDVLLDTNDQEGVMMRNEVQKAQDINSPGMRDEDGGQDPLVNAALPDPSSGGKLRLSCMELHKVILRDTKVQSMSESAVEKSVLLSQDIMEPDSSTPPEGRGGLSDASQTTPSVGQNSSLHSQPASYRALCRSE